MALRKAPTRLHQHRLLRVLYIRRVHAHVRVNVIVPVLLQSVCSLFGATRRGCLLSDRRGQSGRVHHRSRVHAHCSGRLSIKWSGDEVISYSRAKGQKLVRKSRIAFSASILLGPPFEMVVSPGPDWNAHDSESRSVATLSLFYAHPVSQLSELFLEKSTTNIRYSSASRSAYAQYR